jgi:putative DNA methylase
VPPRVRFTIKSGQGTPPEPTKQGRGATFKCPCCGMLSTDKHVKAEGKAGRMAAQLMAVAAEGTRGRIYLPPSDEMEEAARGAHPIWAPEQQMPKNPRWFSPPDYGMPRFGDLFTPRQLVALTTFSDLVLEAREKVLADARQVMGDEEWRSSRSFCTGEPKFVCGCHNIYTIFRI